MEMNPQSYTPDGVAVFATDNQLLVKFFKHAELSHHKSKQSGMPIYDNVDMVSVINPGEKEEVKVVADEFHKRRFPKQWEAYKAGMDQEQSGTPLDHLFPNEPGTILTLKTFHVYTIQQLAAISDTAMGQLPMGRTLSDKAKAYLSSASSGQNFHTMQSAMQKQIDDLKSLLADQGIQAPTPPALNLPDEPQPEVRRGPGKPRREAKNAA